MKKLFSIFFIICLKNIMLFGQQYPNQPELPFLEDVYTFALLELDNNNLIEEDSIVLAKNNINNTLFYGIFVDLNLNPYQVGKWVEKENSMIWQLKIHSPSAHSLAIVLDSLNLPEGASITIFDQNLNQSIESYTSTYNTLSTLTTPNITGNSLYIELVCPKDKIGEPLLIFKEIIHDYRGVFAEKGFEVAPILPCHIDINCPEGDDWQTHKKSVTMMSYSYTANSIFFGLFRDKRSGISTGAMINNTKFDGKPYFLTAEHNLDLDNLDKYIANIVFYFDYENENCNGNKFSFENTIVGASLKALNKYSDFALLELSTKVPSSYFPYFAGWNRVEDNVTHGIGIHHPKGNPKKISFANNLILPNSSDIYLGGNRIFYTNSVWKVNYDNGTTEIGSSGSPLFNPDGKIIGQLYGKRFSYEMGCPDPQVTKLYGRLSVSWDHGSSSSTRLKEWLDPINSNPDEILGLIPEGWRNDWLTGWNQPPSHKVHMQIKSLAVGEGGQVFYRGADNKMQSYYYNTSTSTWVHDWVSAHNIPNHEFIDGDVVVGEGNQLFYRGRDGKMQTYYWSNGVWHHGWVTSWNSPNHENVSAVPGSIAIGNGNQIFYRGTDNKMHTYYWTGSGWEHAWLSSGAPNWQNVAGDIVVGKYGGNNQVFYRGTDGKMQMYWYDFSTNQWNHAWVTSGNAPSYEDVKSIPGSIAIGSDNTIYYRGIDNFVHMYYWESNSWKHGWMINGANSNQKISGDITVNGDQVCYRGFDGKMHIYWYNHNNNQWVHDWLENSWQAPTLNNVGGAVEAGNGAIFYRANHDGLVRIYYWDGSQIITNNNDEFYAMDQVITKPKIPLGSSELKMLVYPNPVENNLYVNIFSPQEDTYLFTLTSISGSEVIVASKSLFQGSNSFELPLANHVKPGVYILSAQNQRTFEKVQEKIIKL